MRAGAVAAALAGLCAGQAPDPADLLGRARASLAAVAPRSARYTCTQTVTRSFYRQSGRPRKGCDAILAEKRIGPARIQLMATDRLRLEVAVADSGREIYSWAGAGRIDSEAVTELIGGGPFGTGALGPFIADIFTNPGAIFSPGRNPGEYRFRVPRQFSHYQVHGRSRSHFIAYDGSFLLDPDTAELKRLAVRTAELPDDTGQCEATTTLEFQARGATLLPRESRLRFIGRNGDETENITAFSNCREYTGESVVRFDADAGPAAPAPDPARERSRALPAGLRLRLALETPIDTATAAAGDPVAARVLSKVGMVPEGAIVRGRIVKMEHHVSGEPYFLISLWFETIEIGGGLLPFRARLRHRLSGRYRYEPYWGRVDSLSAFSRAGTFVFHSPLIPRGYASEWITLSPELR